MHPTRRTILTTATAAGFLAFTGSASAHTAPATVRYDIKSASVGQLQATLGGLKVDNHFGRLTLGGVISFQIKRGLLPDGVVGPITWSHLNNQAQPVTTTSFGGSGSKRIIVDKFNNIVFLVRPDGTVEAWGWSVDNDVKTATKATTVSQKVLMNRNLAESGAPGNLRLPFFTRFDGGNGFHAIPINTAGQPIHSTSQLGRGTSQTSLGCVRLDRFAEQLYYWAPIGTPVNVVDQVTSRS